MKKYILLGALAVVVVLLALYGRTLLDLYRLNSFVAASAAADEADGGAWPRRTDACTVCHGVKGNSQHQGYPKLAGQPAPYVANQLRRFASGERANPNMSPLAMTMTDADIERFSTYYAGQPGEDNRFFEPDPALRDKGGQLVARANCTACHGEQLKGHDGFPRLAGQGYDYLVAQLDAFAANARKDPSGAMNPLAAAASADDRKAMAAYLASFKSTTPSSPKGQ